MSNTASYDRNNVFARILRGELPCKKVFEDEFALAFEDLHPAAPVHVLVIPKGAYVSYDHFARDASDAEILDLNRMVAKICETAGVEEGFRAISNARLHGVQEVPHFHLHILGGRPLGRMLERD